jgi:hypothetical protein
MAKLAWSASSSSPDQSLMHLPPGAAPGGNERGICINAPLRQPCEGDG